MDYLSVLPFLSGEGFKGFILLRSFGSWIRRSRWRFKRSLRRLRSALLDALLILGGAALIAGVWYLCWC